MFSRVKLQKRVAKIPLRRPLLPYRCAHIPEPPPRAPCPLCAIHISKLFRQDDSRIPRKKPSAQMFRTCRGRRKGTAKSVYYSIIILYIYFFTWMLYRNASRHREVAILVKSCAKSLNFAPSDFRTILKYRCRNRLDDISCHHDFPDNR